MNYKFLGNTGVKVSELCFGTMSFGGIADEEMSRDMFHLCRDRGINFFDCADVYEKGRSETILGKFIADCRDEVVITSKFYFRTSDDVNGMGASRYHLVRSVEQSLKHLNTDYIDLYFIHRYDDVTPLEETLRALDDLVSQGKILYIGASNFAAWQIMKANGIANLHHWNKIACIQPMYNLVKRQAESEILPMAESEKIGVISYSPLGGGLLTGKYRGNETLTEGRLISNRMYQERYKGDWMYDFAHTFADKAQLLGYHPAALAIAWTGAHPAITAPIIGARNTAQLAPCIDAVDIKMTPELYSEISSMTPAPPPATDRNEERSDHNYGLRT